MWSRVFLSIISNVLNELKISGCSIVCNLIDAEILLYASFHFLKMKRIVILIVTAFMIMCSWILGITINSIFILPEQVPFLYMSL